MRIVLPLLITFYFFASLSVVGQNLVPNPSFELAQKLPNRKGNSINRAKNWSAPKYSSDYYYQGTGRHSGTSKNIFGKQKPHSGLAYGGICTRKKFLEYLQVKLTDTLIKDQVYLVELYISRAERSIRSLKEFGVYFTDKKIIDIAERGLAIKPQVDFMNDHGFRSKKKWIKLSAIYKAEGSESVMILGHFNYDPNDDKRWILSHYYIDDVSITPENNNDNEQKEYDEVLKITEKETIDSIPHTFAPKAGETITLKNVFFATNKSELLPASFTELDKLVQYLNKDFRAYIKISGHTDNTGNEEQNKTLSELRAKAVADYLKTKGVDSFRINYEGYGSLKPIATNNTEKGKQLNRRVEFTINK